MTVLHSIFELNINTQKTRALTAKKKLKMKTQNHKITNGKISIRAFLQSTHIYLLFTINSLNLSYNTHTLNLYGSVFRFYPKKTTTTNRHHQTSALLCRIKSPKIEKHEN